MTSSNDRDDSQVRRIVADLRDDAPVRPAWDDIERRSAQHDADVVDLADHRRRRLLAAAASVAIVGVGAAALVVTGDRDTADPVAGEPLDASTLPDLVPATSNVPPTTSLVPDTTAPVVPETTVSTGPLESVDSTTTSSIAPTTTAPVFTTTTIPVLDLEPTPLAGVRSIPLGSWVASGNAPAGLVEVYTIDEAPRRTVAYSDGRALVTVVAEPLGFPSGDPVQIDDVTWLRTTAPESDSIDYTTSIGDTQITVRAERLADDAITSFLATLVVGDDRAVTTPRLETFGLEVVARSGSARYAVSGNAGWYCTEFATGLGSGGRCRVGRAGELASATEEISDETTRYAAGIVAPEVAAVEAVFADGTTRRADATDLSGRHDDRFYVIVVSPVTPPGPTGDPAPPYDLRLIAADGTVLGTAPAVER